MNLESLNSRLDRGWQLSKIVYAFVKDHKKTLFFMGFSAALFVVVFVLLTIILLPSAFFSLFLPTKAIVPILLTFLFIFFIFSSLVSELSNVALSCYVLQILNNEQPPSIQSSIWRAFSRLSTIFAWASINALIGTWVKILQNQNGTSTVNKIIGNLFSSTILLSWNVLTFFTTPLIAAEDTGVLDTVKESGNIMQKQWGKALATRFGIHWIGLSLLLFFYALFFTPFCLIIHFAPPTTTDEKTFYTTIGLIGFFLPLIIILYLLRTMTIILKTVLYNYAKNKPTGPFGKELLQSTFLPSN